MSLNDPDFINPINLVAPELKKAVPDLLNRLPLIRPRADYVLTSDDAQSVLAEMKQSWALNTQYIPDAARKIPVEQIQIDDPELDQPVAVFLVGERTSKLKPAIVHMHGGGYVIGRAEEYLPILQAISATLNCLILSVDYQLAPESTYPEPLNECYAALKWLYDSASELGVDRNRIAIQGESAGGGLAAMLAIHARNKGEVPVCFQVLTHPMLDDRTGTTRTVPPHMGTYGWTRIHTQIGWSSFLGQPAGAETVPAGSVPAREPDLADLPETFIWVGALDLFVDENLSYASRLVAAQVSVELHLIPGVYHSFLSAAPSSSISKGYWERLISAYSRVFNCMPAENYLRYFVPE